MNMMQRLLIRQRIWLLVGLCLVGLALLAGLSVNKAQQQFLDLKKCRTVGEARRQQARKKNEVWSQTACLKTSFAALQA